MLCDLCTSDTSFEEQAIAAPGDYSIVYVSNRDTNETRKFDRTIRIKALDDGLERRVTVSRTALSPREHEAFAEAIRKATVTEIVIDRNDLN